MSSNFFNLSPEAASTIIAAAFVGTAIVCTIIAVGLMIRRTMRETSQEQIDQRNRIEGLRRQDEEKRNSPEGLVEQAAQLRRYAHLLANQPNLPADLRLSTAVLTQQTLDSVVKQLSTALVASAHELKKVEGLRAANPATKAWPEHADIIRDFMVTQHETLDGYKELLAAAIEEVERLCEAPTSR